LLLPSSTVFPYTTLFRSRMGQRVLMHILNASAIENRSLAFPGHQFHILALDGNPVPSPKPIDQIFIGPGERVDAYVEMNQPGVRSEEHTSELQSHLNLVC